MPVTSTSFKAGHSYLPRRRDRTPAEQLEYKRTWAREHYRNLTPEEKRLVRVGERRRYHAQTRFSKYGITKADYDEYFDAQEGCCAFCDRPLRRDIPGLKSQIAIDHDHETNEVRGLVHIPCNSVIAHAERNDAFISYIENSRLGAAPVAGKEPSYL